MPPTAGLVHRDLKPSNVLVERTPDGGLRPYVMDFGLARDWKEGATATGTVLGTPHFMSPEQARGEVARLDRRADVYSLGATLYACLTGQSPVPGDNGLEVLSNIATAEPRAPRSLDRDMPSDLEAITLKCLEKDRSARYGSARELSEDLGRFLEGEPVLARTGPGYRARKWLRKHRRPVAAASVALLAVSLALGQAVLARREVTQRETLARRFTEGVERIEAQARYSGTTPLHDTRADREARLREAEARYREPALDYLRRGAGAEVPAPEYVAALLAFYEDRTDEALAKLDALGTRLPWFHEAPLLRGDLHLARALRRWNTGDREGARAEFDSGRQAYAAAADIGRSVPSVYRALTLLEYEALVVEVYRQGDVLPPYTRGVEVAERALIAARDDTVTHVLAAALHRRLAEQRSRQGGEVEPLLDQALASAREALALTPSEPKALTELALASRQRANHRQEKGQDVSALLREAAATFERIPAEGRDFDFHINRGLVFKVWADHEDGAARVMTRRSGLWSASRFAWNASRHGDHAVVWARWKTSSSRPARRATWSRCARKGEKAPAGPLHLLAQPMPEECT